ncbi:CDP-glycerol glycerophosphotransferase family protein [Tetragenococcus halophilus]|uniref:CDP-glycerol glycerophosphotransferase family protein n=1 Tax=Tetragenococcus halophilus TaxID=51669 RepID=UPI000CC6ABBB|nr:CDP-glycerol glycerophosphotransferase family protein [Tetragenococcus halophilus]MDN6502096.1 CDP-glycerol glycerophosphotransferase family protein [Tetragenococcus koreensis]MCF1676406.1 CDP-glycerol glycerophosphotransferase family protein [Tetragenococcus halophilus]MDN6540742.1 CDP-glycerol glycerophosphotransferase family protein [Tetragenococcus koreensis]WJS82942.1 CDP-glycerol glycerophosphotransferase family protein [Tetragenococcus halophilus]GBD83241.1 putative teichoic acid bio
MIGVSINNGKVCLESEEVDLTSLRVQSKQGECLFFKNIAESKWEIPVSRIVELLSNNKDKRGFIFFGDKKNAIDCFNLTVNAKTNLHMNTGEHDFYMFVSMDGYLRIILDKIPTAKTYFKDSEITEIKTVYPRTLKLNFTITSKYFPLTNSYLIIKNRKEGKEFAIEAKFTGSSQNGRVFVNKFTVFFDPKDVVFKLLDHINCDSFDFSVFDFSFVIENNVTKISDHKFRAKSPKFDLSETWLDFSSEYKVLFSWYNTIHSQLSARIGFLSVASYLFYDKLIQTKNYEQADKRIVLITEYPNKAQDNGFAFFKYLMEKQNEFTPYYIIEKDSPDVKYLSKYKNNIVYFKSQDHIRLFFKANYLLHTHTPKYAMPFHGSLVQSKLKSMKKIFLQHGIIALKDVGFVYDYNQHPDFTNAFIVSSSRELETVHKMLNYPKNLIKVTGLTRFDSLLKNNNPLSRLKERKNVLIMPTWRKDLERVSDNVFIQSEFYKNYQALINDSRLKQLVEEENIELNFFLHNNFQKYRHLFSSKFVNILKPDSTPIQNHLKNNGILITDYSSVGLDFSIQKKPVLYYQFDKEISEVKDQVEASSEFLPGPVYQTKEGLIDGIYQKIRVNMLDKKFKKVVKKQIYPFNDTKACDRVYDVLREI